MSGHSGRGRHSGLSRLTSQSGHSGLSSHSGQSAKVYRIEWIPGSDLLHGVCHCGAEHRAPDPVAMWEWMLGHPQGHETAEEGVTDERRP